MKRRTPKRKQAPPGTLPVTEFKARCLEILETLRQRGRELVVTRHGEPIVRVLPIREREPLRGMLKDQLEIVGEIVRFDLGDEWEANR